MQVYAILFRLIPYNVTFIKLTEELLIILRLLRRPGPWPAGASLKISQKKLVPRSYYFPNFSLNLAEILK